MNLCLFFPLQSNATYYQAHVLSDVNLIYERITENKTRFEFKTPESLVCTFYSSISQQFISEITVNISFPTGLSQKDCSEGQNKT